VETIQTPAIYRNHLYEPRHPPAMLDIPRALASEEASRTGKTTQKIESMSLNQHGSETFFAQASFPPKHDSNVSD